MEIDMPTQKQREIINVTEDVFDLTTAKRHFIEEETKGNYAPILFVRPRGGKTAYCVSRIPISKDDELFVTEMKRYQAQEKRANPVVVAVPMSYLFILDSRRDLVPCPA
jgi:hypothetical protein